MAKNAYFNGRRWCYLPLGRVFNHQTMQLEADPSYTVSGKANSEITEADREPISLAPVLWNNGTVIPRDLAKYEKKLALQFSTIDDLPDDAGDATTKKKS